MSQAGSFSTSISPTPSALIYTYTAISSGPYTVLSTDEVIGVDSTSGDITVLLPNNPTTGRVIIIKDSAGNADTNTILVTTVGGTVLIDDGTDILLNTSYEALNFIFTGTKYLIF